MTDRPCPDHDETPGREASAMPFDEFDEPDEGVDTRGDLGPDDRAPWPRELYPAERR